MIEGLAIYSVVLGLVWAIYSMRAHRTRREAALVLAESEEAGLMQPASLHPLVDHAKCLGCGACVEACPEENVLGLIDRKAELTKPANCIGHGACREVCPFDAITLVLGTEERGVDIPLVSPDFETNMPGVFVAGELGGMGLIRNGIEQGKQAIESVAALIGADIEIGAGDAGDPVLLDLVIIGAGPAGLAASLAATERGLRFETLEQESLGGTVAHYPRGKIVMTAPVDLPLYGPVKLRETTKEALLTLWEDVIEKTGVAIRHGERVTAVERQRDGLFLVSATNYRFRTRCVLLAIGRRGTPRKLGVAGEEQEKVVYRLVDPEQYAGRHVLVVGGGDSALEAAGSLAAVENTVVTLSYRNKAFGRAKVKNRESVECAREDGSLEVILSSKVTAIGEDFVEFETEHGKVVRDNDAVIICVGGVLPTDFLRSIGIGITTKRGEA